MPETLPVTASSPPSARDRAVTLVALAATLALIHWVPNRPAVTGLLLATWGLLFYPFSTAELVAFVVGALFFVGQDYATLKAGSFEFRFKDILLMPWYEPPLWGFYFLAIKRVVVGRGDLKTRLSWKSLAGLLVTSTVFSLFSADAHTLFLASLASTGVLFVLFHTATDLAFAATALALGAVIELFGVGTGLWKYPEPDVLGIPYWFSTMWVSVGLLGARFLIPLSEWMARRIL